MNVHTITGWLVHSILEVIKNVSLKGQGVDWCRCLTSIGLESRCHETLREEEGREPESHWGAIVQPVGDELETQEEVWDPRA